MLTLDGEVVAPSDADDDRRRLESWIDLQAAFLVRLLRVDDRHYQHF